MAADDTLRGPGISRRTVLGALGAGAAGFWLAGCEDPARKETMQLPNAGPHYGEGNAPLPRSPLPPVTVTPTNAYGIIPRAAWAREGPNMAKIQPMDGVTRITFHHSGQPEPFTTTDYGATALHLEKIREDHRDTRKWADIAYHFAIDRAGRVWQLRSLNYQGSHVESNNAHNIGIVVLGNFDLQSMTAAQKDKVQTFGRLVRTQYALKITQVKTHQEIRPTECPGNNMQPFMVTIRNKGLI